MNSEIQALIIDKQETLLLFQAVKEARRCKDLEYKLTRDPAVLVESNQLGLLAAKLFSLLSADAESTIGCYSKN